MTDRLDRAVGAVHGLALGDALGAPAGEHRTVRDPWVRQMLRKGPLELDESRVLRPVVPFVLSAVGAPALVATDDAEGFAVAARVLLEAPGRDTDSLFDTWRDLLDTPDTWTSAAQRSALINAASGLRPPHTGADNPAFYDDSALPAALAVALATSAPDEAAVLARAFAVVTHDGTGVHAAAAYARVLANLLDGAPLRPALESGAAEVVADGWLADGLRDAFHLVDEAPSPFAALPALVARFAPRTYSHPGTVAETLPLALAVTALTGADHETALPLALSVTRHQDSLPALVGALCGAAGSAPEVGDVDVLQGVTVPAVAGRSLADLARSLDATR